MLLQLIRQWPWLHPVARRVRDGWYTHDGTHQHYVACGQGPLVILIHGVPEFWYSWRHQIDALAATHRVVAVDQAGFCFSQAPKTDDGYQTARLADTIVALIAHLGYERAIIVGHDTGAWLAWHVAALHPQLVERLIILSVPHPNAMRHALAQGGAQAQASVYAQQMQPPGAKALFRPWQLSMLFGRAAVPLYLVADAGTNLGAITAFYRHNYPCEPYALDPEFPLISAPTLIIHGSRDTALLTSSHDTNRQWLVHEPTMMVLNAGHFVHQEQPAEVNRIIIDWLNQTIQE